MPKQPTVSAAQLVKAFENMDFVKVSQKGSHIKMKASDGRTAIIPNHKLIKPGTLKKGIFLTLPRGLPRGKASRRGV